MLTYEQAVEELFYSIHRSSPTNYYAVLYRLISKADEPNKALLRLSYPMEVLVWEEWQQSEDANEFFASVRVKVLDVVSARLSAT